MNAKCAFPKRYGAICLTYVPYLGSGSTWTGHKRLKIKPPSGSDGGQGGVPGSAPGSCSYSWLICLPGDAGACWKHFQYKYLRQAAVIARYALYVNTQLCSVEDGTIADGIRQGCNRNQNQNRNGNGICRPHTFASRNQIY